MSKHQHGHTSIGGSAARRRRRIWWATLGTVTVTLAALANPFTAPPAVAATATVVRPTLTTSATPNALRGGRISDTATLAGGDNPRGTILFRAFGPGDTTCTGSPVHNTRVMVHGNGTYKPPGFAPTAAGTYRWIAAYSGDHHNAPAATACNDPGETTIVSPVASAPSTITTGAWPPVAALGHSIFEDSVLTTTAEPTGTITFRAYGPDDATCSGPLAFFQEDPFPVPDQLHGSNFVSTTVTTFVPKSVGTYQWTAAYSGDANNAPAATPCNDPGESTLVVYVAPTLTTTATPSTTLGGQISDTATLAGALLPQAPITFRAFGPDDTTCTGTPVFTSTASGFEGTYVSDTFTPTAAGTYRWIAAYSGDQINGPVSTSCNDPGETSVVTPDNDDRAVADRRQNPNSLPTGLPVATPDSPTGSLR